MGQLLAHLRSLAIRSCRDDEPPRPLRFPDLGVKRLREGIRSLENGTAEALHTLLRRHGFRRRYNLLPAATGEDRRPPH